jgi:hypothetical protein
MMAKFIKIKDSLINVDKVTNFELSAEEIWVFFDDGSNPLNIFCTNEHEARLIFEDIPHLIDNNYIPQWTREVSEPIPCKPEYFNLDYEYDELPF